MIDFSITEVLKRITENTEKIKITITIEQTQMSKLTKETK
mgnify:CR=1 FL=1